MAEKIRCLEEYNSDKTTKVVGPLRVTAESFTEYPLIHEKLADNEEVGIPLSADHEPGIYTCVNRGAKFSRQVGGGVNVYIASDFMTRAPVLEAPTVRRGLELAAYINKNHHELKEIAESTTRFGKVHSIKPYNFSKDVHIRLAMQCGDAAGHNMTTKAGTALAKYLVEKFPELKYGSDSGNMCTDKKAAAINALTGRGHSALTEIVIPRRTVETVLKTTPELLARLDTKKNKEGGFKAGTLFSANAHYANIAAAIYDATGQDLANVVEASFGGNQIDITHEGDLFFSTNQPCIIVGTIGSGKTGPSTRKSLETLGCLKEGKQNGYNSQRFAAMIAAATAMGELSLLADQTKSGRLIEAHEKIER